MRPKPGQFNARSSPIDRRGLGAEVPHAFAPSPHIEPLEDSVHRLTLQGNDLELARGQEALGELSSLPVTLHSRRATVPPFKPFESFLALRRNLEQYFKKHPDWEEYTGQDKLDPEAYQAGLVAAQTQSKRRRVKEPDHETPETSPAYLSQKHMNQQRSLPHDMYHHHGPPQDEFSAQMEFLNSMQQRKPVNYSALQQQKAAQHAHQLAARREYDRATKMRQAEAREAMRWREFGQIQRIIDHYNQGPARQPSLADEWFSD